MRGMLLQSTLQTKAAQWIQLRLSKTYVQSRVIHAPSRIVHVIRTHWESRLSFRTDRDVQSFVHIHVSA
jgi:hypothetical protein